MHRLLCVLALAALGMTWLHSDDVAPADAPQLPETADVSPIATPSTAGVGGKALAITIKSDPTYGIYLQDSQVLRLGGNEFLVGTGVDSGVGEWSAGRRIWVAVDDVSEIVEFKDGEDLKKTLTPEDAGPDA